MSREQPETSIWFIRHKETQDLWEAPSGKSSWRKKGHAKSAWATLCQSEYSAKDYSKQYGVPLKKEWSYYRGEISVFPKFDEQDIYELVEINNLAGDLVDSLREIIEQMINYLPEDKKAEYLLKYKRISE